MNVVHLTMKKMKKLKENEDDEEDEIEKVENHFLSLRGSLLLTESHESRNTISITTTINFYVIYQYQLETRYKHLCIREN
jgi:hypothetical protein